MGPRTLALLFGFESRTVLCGAEISCGKTELEHNCTISISRMKNDFSVCRRGASDLFCSARKILLIRGVFFGCLSFKFAIFEILDSLWALHL